jgi:hypothetical protein
MKVQPIEDVLLRMRAPGAVKEEAHILRRRADRGASRRVFSRPLMPAGAVEGLRTEKLQK